MQVKAFLTTMGIGIAVGALGILMLPKSGSIYHAANDAASAIKTEAEKAIDSIG